VKVGERGKMVLRSNCARCGTMPGALTPNNAFLNRNAVYDKGGRTHEGPGPANKHHASIRVRSVRRVPVPSYGVVPPGMALSFVPGLLGFGERRSTKDCALFPAYLSKVEVVPVTWK